MFGTAGADEEADVVVAWVAFHWDPYFASDGDGVDSFRVHRLCEGVVVEG